MKDTKDTIEFTEIWEMFFPKLKEVLKQPHKLFLKIIQERFGKWKMKENVLHKKITTHFPKKIEKDDELMRFTDFSITIYNHHISETTKSCYIRWKDISFSPQSSGNKKSPGVRIHMCVRDGYTKDKLEDNGKYVESWKIGSETSLKDSIVEISAFDNKEFVNFINKWMKEFPKKLKAVEFNTDGSIKN